MSCDFTLMGLRTLLHGNGAPIWRAIVNIGNSTAINLAAVVVAALCIGFITERIVWFRTSMPVDEKDPQKYIRKFGAWYPLLMLLALVLSPSIVLAVTRLSPFLIALVPPLLGYAILFSLVSCEPTESPDGADSPVYRETRGVLGTRLFLSGAFFAVGAWESTLGIVLAIGGPIIALHWTICRGNSVIKMLGPWFFGFALAAAGEMLALKTCTPAALRPTVPNLWLFLSFALAGVFPFYLVLKNGAYERVKLGFWIALLVGCAALSGYRLLRPQVNASRVFVDRCMAELGSRKIVILDGIFDDMFRAVKPVDVDMVGTRTIPDKEYLINHFETDEVVTNRALVVRDCYEFPEFQPASMEAQLAFKRSVKQIFQYEPKKAEKHEPIRHQTEEEKASYEAMQREHRAKVYERMLRDIAEPTEAGLKVMGTDFAKVPKDQRKDEIEKARLNLRTGWVRGARGTQISASLLTLDMMAGDAKMLEEDAIMVLIDNREDPAANAALGRLRLIENRLEDAEKYLIKAVKGGGAMAMCDYARVLVTKGDFEAAEKWARQAVGAVPTDPQMREPLVATLVETKRFDAASQELKKMLSLVGENDQDAKDRTWDFAAQVNRRMAELKAQQ